MRNRLAGDGGQAGVFAVGLFLVALMVVGLALDVGLALADRSALRAAADTAALGAANAVNEGLLSEGTVVLDEDDAAARARIVGRAGLGTDIAMTIEVTDVQVRVTLSRTRPTVFVRLLGINEATVGASATANVRRAG